MISFTLTPSASGWVKVTRVEDTATHLQQCTLSTVCLQICTEWTILTRHAWMYPLERQTSSERRAEVAVLMPVLAAAGRRKCTVLLKQFDHFAFSDGSDTGEALVSDKKKSLSCLCKGSLPGQDPKLILLLFWWVTVTTLAFEIHETEERDTNNLGSYMPKITCIFVLLKFLP